MTAPARTQRRPLLQVTSRDAHRDVDRQTIDDRIVEYVRVRGGATVAEICADLGLEHQTASAQVSHMRAPGPRQRLYASNDKRLTPRGREATVWKVGTGPSLAPFVRPNAITEQLDLPGVRS